MKQTINTILELKHENSEKVKEHFKDFTAEEVAMMELMSGIIVKGILNKNPIELRKFLGKTDGPT